MTLSPSDRKLLRAISNCIDMDRLRQETPRVTREQVDDLFERLVGSPAATPTAPNATAAPLDGSYIVNCDGASRNNPGPAAIGIVIRDGQSNVLEEIAERLGTATNNEAEYRAIIRAAERLVELGAQKATFLVDSELLARQVSGQYKTKSPTLVPLLAQLRSLLDNIPHWSVRHVPRAQNAAADALANQALDSA